MENGNYIHPKSTYIKQLSVEEAVSLIKENCKNIKSIDQVLWRGANDTNVEAALFEGQLSYRSSANTSSHYSLILDDQLSKMNLPLRSKCVISANNLNRRHAEQFGGLYAIFPFDDTKLAVCPHYDMWDTETNIISYSFEEFNGILWELEIPDDSLEIICNYIENSKNNLYKKSNGEYDDLLDYLYSESSVIEAFNKMLDINECGFSFITTKELSSIDTEKEIWFGGKSIAVSEIILEEVIQILNLS